MKTKGRVFIGCLCAVMLAAVACADGRGTPTSPSASAGTVPLAVAPSSSPRSGALHVTKECSEYTGQAGAFCTITSSNLDAIEVGSRVVYASAAGPEGLDSDVVLDPPGPGSNAAFGHCTLSAVISRCTFSGGTGKFTWFNASVEVSYLGGPDYGWNGTYSFSPRD
jgi:hypothetical protein